MIEQTLEEAFPLVAPGVRPLGSRILVQIRTPKSKTKAGLILHHDTKDTERWNTQIAKVVDMGPLAFKNRNTMESWPEGQWCGIGDFVRVPKYGGDRWSVDVGEEKDAALFVIFNDHDIVGKIEGDPLAIKVFM